MLNITPEIRQAVLDAECLARGHEVNVYDAIRPSGPTIAGEVTSDDPLRMPSMSCYRCGRTWIVIPAEGADYDDAERRLFAMLNPESNVATTLLRNRSLRIERDAAEPEGDGTPG